MIIKTIGNTSELEQKQQTERWKEKAQETGSPTHILGNLVKTLNRKL